MGKGKKRSGRQMTIKECVFASVCVFEKQRARRSEGECKAERERKAEGGELI